MNKLKSLFLLTLLALVTLPVLAQEVDDLQEYLDQLALQERLSGIKPAKVQRRADGSIQIPVGLTEVDLSTFTSAQNRTTPLTMTSSVKFVNGSITAASNYSGSYLLKIQKKATVVLDATASIDASNVGSANCPGAVGIYNTAAFYECGNITAPDKENGVAIYMDAETTTFNYVSGTLIGSINNPKNGTVNGLNVKTYTKEELLATLGEIQQMLAVYKMVLADAESTYSPYYEVFSANLVKTIKAELDALTSELDALQAQCDDLTSSVQTADASKYITLFAQIEKLKEQTDGFKATLEERLQVLKETVKNQAANEFQAQVNNLQNEINAMAAMLQELYQRIANMEASFGEGYFSRTSNDEFDAELASCKKDVETNMMDLNKLVADFNNTFNGLTIASIEDVQNAYALYKQKIAELDKMKADVQKTSIDVEQLGVAFDALPTSFPDEETVFSLAPKNITVSDPPIQMGYKSNRGWVLTAAGMIYFEKVNDSQFRLKDNEDNYLVVDSKNKLVAGTQEEASLWTGQSVGNNSYVIRDAKTRLYLAYSNGVKVNTVLTVNSTAHAWTIEESELDDLQAFLYMLSEEEEQAEVTDPDTPAPGEKDTLIVVIPSICIGCGTSIPTVPYVFPRVPYPIEVHGDKEGEAIIPRPATGAWPTIDYHPIQIPKGSHVIFDDITFKEITGGHHIIYVEGVVEINVTVNIYVENWEYFVHVGPGGRVIWRTKGDPNSRVKNEGVMEVVDATSYVEQVDNTGTLEQKGGKVNAVINRNIFVLTGGFTNYIWNWGTVRQSSGTVLTARNYENCTYEMSGGVIDNTIENTTDTVFVNRGVFRFTGGIIRGWGSRLFYHAKGAYLYIDGGQFDLTHIKDYFIEAYEDFYIRGDYQIALPMLLQPTVVVRIIEKWIYKFNIVFIDNGRPAPRQPLFWADVKVLKFTRDYFPLIGYQFPNHRWRWWLNEEKNTIEPRDEEVEDEDDLQAYLDWLAEYQDSEAVSSEDKPQELDLKDRTIVLTKFYTLPVGVYVNFYNVTFVYKGLWPTDAEYLFTVPKTTVVRWHKVVIDLSQTTYYIVNEQTLSRRLFQVWGHLYFSADCYIKGWIDPNAIWTSAYIPGAWIDLTDESRIYLDGGWLENVVIRSPRYYTTFVTKAITKTIHFYLDDACLQSGLRLIAPAGGYRITTNDLQYMVFHYLSGEWDFTIDEEGYVVIEKKKEKGDANGDYVIDEKDIALVADHFLGKPITGRFFINAADADGNGVVDVRDVVWIWRKYQGVTTVAEPSKNDVLTATAFDIRMGGTATLMVNLQNQSTDITALQFDLVLPEGITLQTADGDAFLAELSSRFADAGQVLTIRQVEGKNAWRFLCYSLLNAAITGTEGTIITLSLQAIDNLAKGEYEAVLENIMLSNTSAAGLDAADVKVATQVEMPVISRDGGDMAAGWYWVSTGIDDLSDPLAYLSPFGEKADRLLSSTQELVKDSEFGLVGNLKELAPQNGYRLHTTAAASAISWQGQASSPADSPVTLSTGWNWIGYVPRYALKLDEALSGLKATVGDRISYQEGFADYTANGWMGTLTMLQPGQGYQYHREGAETTFTYPAKKEEAILTKTNFSREDALRANDAEMVMPWQYDVHAYPDNVTMIVQLCIDGMPVDGGYSLGAFCNGECRGVAKSVGDVLFLTVHGTTGIGETITFAAFNHQDGQLSAVDEQIPFEGQCIGKVDAPMLLNANGTVTAIGNVTNSPATVAGAYSLSGQKVEKAALRKGVYIINGQKRVVR